MKYWTMLKGGNLAGITQCASLGDDNSARCVYGRELREQVGGFELCGGRRPVAQEMRAQRPWSAELCRPIKRPLETFVV